LLFCLIPYFNGFEDIFKYYNYVLIFTGLGISFSTLQDTSKTQNNFSKRIWENPRKGSRLIIFISCFTLLVLGFGIFGYFISESTIIKELAFGTIVLGIGLIGFLKTGVEVFENHRKDKNVVANRSDN